MQKMLTLLQTMANNGQHLVNNQPIIFELAITETRAAKIETDSQKEFHQISNYWLEEQVLNSLEAIQMEHLINRVWWI